MVSELARTLLTVYHSHTVLQFSFKKKNGQNKRVKYWY